MFLLLGFVRCVDAPLLAQNAFTCLADDTSVVFANFIIAI